ncbi:MAG: hypothetical protein MJ141_06555 [Clostridia bacterium]|nr:hypothetical protein [Clostridia bacterium]
MKKSLRILCALFAMVMVLGVVACGTTGDETVTTAAAATEDPNAPAETKSDKDENGYLLDDIPADLKFNQATVKVLYWNDVERPEFEVEQDELDGNIVSEALYNRNMKTEERLGVVFDWTGQPGDNGDRAAFTDFVVRAHDGGDYFDIIATYSRTSAMLMKRGLLVDLNTVENSQINFEKPWWPKNLVETCTIGDSLYALSGDISTNVLHFMYAIYYNADMLNNLNLPDPVEFVDNKTWTIDKLIELSSDLYTDNDQNGKQSDADNYGFGTIYYHVDAFYTGSTLRLVEQDPDKLLVLSPDYSSQKCVDLVDKLGKWLTTKTCYVSLSGAAVNYYYPFADGNMLFCQNRVYMADNIYGSSNGHNLNGVSWNYGVLPTPLYDENQEEYITMIGNPFTLWGIMAGTSAQNATMAAAVIECMGSQAYREVTPALFETNMKYRYTNSTDDKGTRMFDLLHNTICFDLGRIFSDDLSYMSEIPSINATLGASWATAMKGQLNVLTKKLEKLSEALMEIDK